MHQAPQTHDGIPIGDRVAGIDFVGVAVPSNDDGVIGMGEGETSGNTFVPNVTLDKKSSGTNLEGLIPLGLV